MTAHHGIYFGLAGRYVKPPRRSASALTSIKTPLVVAVMAKVVSAWFESRVVP
jgi:hypothetical protein